MKKDKKNKPYTKKQKRTAKKLRLNINNYKSTSSFVITSIFVLRIVSVFVLILFPILIALASFFDSGIKALILYTLGFLPDFFQRLFAFGNTTSKIENVSRILPFIIWLGAGFLMFFFYFLPFITSKSKKGKGFQSFYFLLLTIIGFFLIYGFQFFIIDLLPHGNDQMSAIVSGDWKTVHWFDLKNNFHWNSFWMISIQIVHIVTFLFFVWAAIESDLIRRKKLSYDDLVIDYSKQRSLVNDVLSGNLEFGSVPDENLKLSIKKLKSKLNIDEQIVTEQLENEANKETELNTPQVD